MNPRALLVACTLSIILPLASSASPAPNPNTVLSEKVYEGIKASAILDSDVLSRENGYLGEVRNLALSDDGQIQALIVERSRNRLWDDAILRVPWNRVRQPIHSGIVITDVNDPTLPDLGIFSRSDRGEEFLVTEVLGEYARLQAGQGYGYVKDAVFGASGKLMAVLVARDSQTEGGTIAFAYPGRTGRWSPDMSYYGLPFVSADQADRNGFKIDPKRFES